MKKIITLGITAVLVTLTTQQAQGTVTITNQGPVAINVHWAREKSWNTESEQFVSPAVDKWLYNIQPGQSNTMQTPHHSIIPTTIMVYTTNFAPLTSRPVELSDVAASNAYSPSKVPSLTWTGARFARIP